MKNLAELFGMNLEDIGKKKTKKGSEQKEKKGIQQKSIDYNMPVRIRSGHISYNFTEKDFQKKTLDEETIRSHLKVKYPELSEVKFELIEFSNQFTEKLEEKEQWQNFSKEEKSKIEENSFLDFAKAENIESLENERDIKPENGCWIKLNIHYQPIEEGKKISYPVTIKIGEHFMRIEMEQPLQQIVEQWKTRYPEYEGCKIYYDDKNHYLVPYMEGEEVAKGKKYLLPVKIGYMDKIETYTKEDFKIGEEETISYEKIREIYSTKYPEFEDCGFSFKKDINLLFPILKIKKEIVKEKIALPITVRTYGIKILYEPTDFKGKNAVTLEEIRGRLEKDYPEYSADRTEMIYDNNGFVIPILKGSRKGVCFISDRANQNLYFTKGRDGNIYRVEQTPYGFFNCQDNGKNVEFYLSIKKIPYEVLNSILTFFKRNPFKEAAAQIFYFQEEMRYIVYFPKQITNTCSVMFERDYELEQKGVLVMDIHSHGFMKAFFSEIDNQDEKGTRLYLVIGNLDKKKVSWVLRAGIIGHYKNLEIEQIFIGRKVDAT